MFETPTTGDMPMALDEGVPDLGGKVRWRVEPVEIGASGGSVQTKPLGSHVHPLGKPSLARGCT
jgi:hypothetical protein